MNGSLGIADIKTREIERRRFRRYHYSAPIFVRPSIGPEIRGMSLEMSECGLSLMATSSLNTGDVVELEPIGGGVARAIVRRVVGKLYGLEFLGLSPAQQKKIRKACRLLPAYNVKTLDIWEH